MSLNNLDTRTGDYYIDNCGCIWKNGKRIELCMRHKHKDILLNNR